MKTSTSGSLITLLVLAVALLLPAPSRADFVSDINTATTPYGVGSRVIYEMNIGMFTPQGTLAAARERLAELRADGIDVIWLMPIYPRGSSNSPYAATSFTQVNPNYGSVADLRAFVARAHDLGMKVWLDWVCNHMAVEAEWVTTHPEYYTTSGGQMVHPNNYQDVYQLNYNNTNCVNALNDCLKFWIDECDVDGYRCDYVSSPAIAPSYWQSAIPLIKSYKNKEISFMGEAEFAAEQTRLNNVGFDYDYAWWYQSRLKEFGTGGTSASTIKNHTNTFVDASRGQSYGRMMFLTNHDQNYNDGGFTMERFYGTNRYALTVLMYTIYGMPLLYNGQEIGGGQVLNYFSDTRIDWSNPDLKMRNTVRTLAALKHSIPALRDATSGSATPQPAWVTVTGSDNVLAFTRKSGDSEALVVINFANSAATVTLSGLTAGTWSCWLNSNTIATGTGRRNDTFGASQQLSLEAKGYRVYVKGSFTEEGITDGGSSPVTTEIPEQAVWTDDTFFAYFEAPADWTSTVKAWAWDDNNNYTGGTWPGADCVNVATLSNGNVLWRWAYNGALTAAPAFIIFSNNGSPQTDNLTFTNGGYYTSAGLIGIVENNTQGGGEEEGNNITVYVRTSDSGVNIYAWNDGGELTSGWPGTAMTQTSTLYGETWLCYTFNNVASLNFILNCGGDETKTDNIEGITSDIFIEYSAAGKSARDITEEVTSGQGGGEVEENNITVYVRTSDSGVNIYAWNDGGELTSGWPGTAMTQTATLYGETWLCYTFNNVASLNFILNCGGDETKTDNIEGITSDIFIEYSAAGKSARDITEEVTSGGTDTPQPDDTVTEVADEAEYVAEALFAYFEAPSTWTGNIYAWVWNDNNNFTGGSWPGQACELVATLDNGHKLWRWVNTSGITDAPTEIIFSNNGTPQTDNLAFTNGGYYSVDGLVGTVEQPAAELPSEATFIADNFFAYFEAPSTWTANTFAWVWTDTDNYTGGSWPGQTCELVATLSNGNRLWRWVNSSSITATPGFIIFSNNGTPQTENLAFVNGGYYSIDGLAGTVTQPAAVAGDINGDESVDGNDVSALLEMVLAGGVSDAQKAVADINGDNSVDGNDVSALLEMVLAGN